ncbi:MAG: leucyl aminopeptidase [Elusimicrobia bacterium]|nr:leucyl aminopeptidase [Elusimicrobiota bacterium]
MISLATIEPENILSRKVPVCLFVFEDQGVAKGSVLGNLRKRILELANEEGFKASPGNCATVSMAEGQNLRRFVLVGLGKRTEYIAETARRASGCLYQYVRSRWPEIAVLAHEPHPVCEGLLLSSYSFQEYKKAEGEKLLKASLIVSTRGEKNDAEKAAAKAGLFSEAVCFVRDLVNRGPSDKTPQSLGELARGLKGPGVAVDIISRHRAQEMGMGSFLGVARGSSVDPVFVHLIYKPKGSARKKIGLVGKGITFDSGGLSLKPPTSMETMKLDMAGAATVLSVFKVLPKLAPKVEVHGFCAFTYNMPGPDALKPGDVIRAMNGKTIEVLNTDAEGRLILADALAYASRQKLDAIIDLATLTGAIITALGSRVTGAMANDKALLSKLLTASQKTGEMICELPLVKDYKENIKSPIADLINTGKPRGEAGSIIGGLFLQEFVDGVPWVHLDIAGTAWTDAPMAYCPSGGTGALARTLLEYLSAL